MIDIWCIYAVNLREKMSQITHFCGVKLLAWKSGCVKFWTNIMSAFVMLHFEQGWFWAHDFIMCYANNSDLPHKIFVQFSGQNITWILFIYHWSKKEE